jgi:hypothetical protein
MAMSIKQNYRDNPLLKRVGVNLQYTQEQIEEYVKCSKDPIYFARHIKIITLDHGLVPFKMYDFQEDMIRTFHENRFVITKCPRQVGKCVHLNTPIRLKNKSTGEIIETTIGEFYEQQRNNKERKLLSKK